MKFTFKEIKEICKKLEDKRCFYRHPQSDFIDILGQDVVNKLLEIGWIKNSDPKTYPGTNIRYLWDYSVPCYEYSNTFRRIYNYYTTPFWLWLKIDVLHLYWFVHKWQRFRIACGHHYDWQDYSGLGLSEI